MRVTTPDIVVENADEGSIRRRGESRGSPSTPSIPLMQTSGSSPSPSSSPTPITA
ncbi:hypothetical protein RSAG8_02108, partial [Rhizoctonia solani AG-8 WAC10335]